MSVAVVVVLAVAGVVIYASRDKLRMLKPRPRMPPTHSGLGLGTPSPRPPVQAPAGQVRTEHLRDYIKHLEQDTQRGLEEEFEQVMQCSAQHPAATAVKDLNKVKNRFRNILPFDHSRVILPLLEGEPCSDYINANHITNTRERQRFVACQGPTNGTVRDFWRLVWQVGTGVVVMLTNLRERGRARCALYWPTLEEPIVAVGDLTVTRCGEAGFAGGLLVREFVLQRGTNQRKIRQYHLTTWPDFGVPSHEHHLLDFISEVRSFVFPESGPLVVHCR
ncbi:Receptor-type tyrosine-protein phosphatase kappa [Chionoecetes opilio]|uniref:Receptor-type tyrosine-protein phosphatase kappa n=1 Tax=Chionoecetes opilio TaxID=41210 RepID=A0A8J5CLX0_CHIOP|nr:Receptor-type tyrosine-protein phosphatase kappa [Chionoecetes opilio]